MKNRNLKISSNIWQQTPPEFFLSNQVTRVRQPMVFQTKDSNHSKIKYTSICHLCHTSFINSETTALLHLTSFTEDVSLSQIQAFICQQLLYEIQANVQHSDMQGSSYGLLRILPNIQVRVLEEIVNGVVRQVFVKYSMFLMFNV